MATRPSVAEAGHSAQKWLPEGRPPASRKCLITKTGKQVGCLKCISATLLLNAQYVISAAGAFQLCEGAWDHGNCCRHWWITTTVNENLSNLTQVYSSIVLKYNFELFVIYLSISIFCYVILPLHYMFKENITLLLHYNWWNTLGTSDFVDYMLCQSPKKWSYCICSWIKREKEKKNRFRYAD